MGFFTEFECFGDNGDISRHILYNDGRRDGHVDTDVAVVYYFNILEFSAIGDCDGWHHLVEAIGEAKQGVRIDGYANHVQSLICSVSQHVT